MVSYQLAAGRIDKKLLHEIIDSILKEEEYSESLKIKIANEMLKKCNFCERKCGVNRLKGERDFAGPD